MSYVRYNSTKHSEKCVRCGCSIMLIIVIIIIMTMRLFYKLDGSGNPGAREVSKQLDGWVRSRICHSRQHYQLPHGVRQLWRENHRQRRGLDNNHRIFRRVHSVRRPCTTSRQKRCVKGSGDYPCIHPSIHLCIHASIHPYIFISKVSSCVCKHITAELTMLAR